MAALVAMMIAATVFEKLEGSPFAFRYFYHSPLFIALWALAAVCGLVYVFSVRMHKKPATLVMHLSFVLILAGALTTHLTSESGVLSLREGKSGTEFIDEDGNAHGLPFSVDLESFGIEYYHGSKAPSDFRTVMTITDGDRRSRHVVSLNNIAKYKGYRFYQDDYDQDMKGSVLAVSRDPWGTGLTYAGYIALALSMLGFFFQKDSGFRRALGRVGGTAAVAVMLFAGNFHAEARSSRNENLPAIPEELASGFGDLYIYYNDRICPLQTMARDFCLKAYGKASYKGYDAVQVVSAWLFYYDWWRTEPFKLKASEKGTAKEDEKRSLLLQAASGEAFKIFPIADSSGTVSWYSCTDRLPEELDFEHWNFVRKALDLVHDEIAAENWQEAGEILSKIKKYQEKTADAVLPGRQKMDAEKVYNSISRPMVPFMASISLGMVLFVLFGIWMARGKKPSEGLQVTLSAGAAVLFAYLTIVIGLRWYVSGNGPFAGSYSVMMLMAWLSCIMQMCLYRKIPLIQPLGFLLAGFTMLVASLASANPQITHLMPVLQSPLLSIHVLSMMISYTLFGLVALNGLMGVFMPGKAAGPLKDISLVILYPAVFLLVFGTFLGAVWANISWGSYWAWDPKETWALVTILVYAAALHGDSIKFFRKPKFFHLFTIFAFLSVLITYFGVNLILGGMHSYV